MLKFVKNYFIYIVVCLIIIILGVSLYGSRTNYEGFTVPDESQYKTFNSQRYERQTPRAQKYPPSWWKSSAMFLAMTRN
jgi:hypothetical protein